MKKIYLLIGLIAVASIQVTAQTNTFPSTGSAGIGTIAPNASSILEMNSTTQGLLMPRMTKAKRDAIVSPATGLIIFQTNSTPGFYYYDGTSWNAVSPKGVNKTLSNLNAPTALNVDLLPGLDNSINIGSSLLRYKDVNLYNLKFADATTQTTAFVPYVAGTSINITGNTITNTAPSPWVKPGSDIYYTAGKVGIGTTTPAAPLDVKTTSNYVAQFNGTAPMYMAFFEGDVYRGYLGSYSGAAEDVDFGTGSGNTTGKLHLTIQAIPKLTIDASGRVGIGTTNPNHLLHISGGDLFVQSSSGLIRLGYEGGNEWQMATTGAGADLRWYTTTDGGTTISPRHYFSQNGNVGIGGFSGPGVPLGRLDVIGSGTNSATNTFLLRNSNGDTLLRMRDDGRMGIGYNNPSYGRTLNLGGSGINFYTSNEVAFGGAIFPTDTSLIMWSNSNSNNYLVLQPSWGNVGIGIYSPQAKLNVVGNTATISSGGFIVAGRITSTNVAIDNDEILARNNGSAAVLKINDASGNTLINPSGSGNVGIATSGPTHKLQIGVDDAAKPSTSTWIIASDARLKTNVKDFNEGLDIVKKIHPVWFEYNGKAGMPTGVKSVGVLAQEMQKIAPYMINKFTYKDETGKSTDYLDYNANDLFYLLVNSVKELSKQNDDLKQKTTDQEKINVNLQQQIDELKKAIGNQVTATGNGVNTNSQSVTLSSSFALEQNVPNPFSGITSINCFLPVNKGNAFINFYSQTGVLLKSVKLTGEGKNTITLTAKQLAAGTYKYALVVDGKLIDTKMMVLQK